MDPIPFADPLRTKSPRRDDATAETGMAGALAAFLSVLGKTIGEGASAGGRSDPGGPSADVPVPTRPGLLTAPLSHEANDGLGVPDLWDCTAGPAFGDLPGAPIMQTSAESDAADLSACTLGEHLVPKPDADPGARRFAQNASDKSTGELTVAEPLTPTTTPESDRAEVTAPAPFGKLSDCRGAAQGPLEAATATQSEDDVGAIGPQHIGSSQGRRSVEPASDGRLSVIQPPPLQHSGNPRTETPTPSEGERASGGHDVAWAESGKVDHGQPRREVTSGMNAETGRFVGSWQLPIASAGDSGSPNALSVDVQTLPVSRGKMESNQRSASATGAERANDQNSRAAPGAPTERVEDGEATRVIPSGLPFRARDGHPVASDNAGNARGARLDGGADEGASATAVRNGPAAGTSIETPSSLDGSAPSGPARPSHSVPEIDDTRTDLTDPIAIGAEATATARGSERTSGVHVSAGHLPAGLGHRLAEAAAQFPDRPVEITLSPGELGRVRLTFATHDGALTMMIQADRPDTLDLLRRNIDSLAQDFRDLGYQNLSFSFGQDRDPRQPPNPETGTASSDRQAILFPEATETGPREWTRPDAPDGRLDLRV